MSGLANDCITAPDAGVTRMLGQPDPQATIFDRDQLYLEHVGERTLYGFLARHRHELFCDKDFAELYDAKRGRPSVPPSLLCVALLLQPMRGARTPRPVTGPPMTSAGRWRLAPGTRRNRSPRARCGCSAPTCCSMRRLVCRRAQPGGGKEVGLPAVALPVAGGRRQRLHPGPGSGQGHLQLDRGQDRERGPANANAPRLDSARTGAQRARRSGHVE